MTPIADISFSPETVGVITVLGGGLVAAIGLLYREMLKAKDGQIAMAEAEKNSFQQMYREAIDSMEIVANQKRRDEGKAPLPKLAAVVPESSSPPSREQIVTGEIATARARLTAATMVLGLPARESIHPIA